MNLLTVPLRLPFLPLTGLIRLAEIIRDQAESEYHAPASARRQLEAAEQAAEAGELSPEQVGEVQREALSRLVRPGDASEPAPDAGASQPGSDGRG